MKKIIASFPVVASLKTMHAHFERRKAE